VPFSGLVAVQVAIGSSMKGITLPQLRLFPKIKPAST
jgi:hypothetical protein